MLGRPDDRRMRIRRRHILNGKEKLETEHEMVKCADCGKEIPEDHDLCCDMCGVRLCEECGTTGLCSACAELWESEIDLEDMEG